METNQCGVFLRFKMLLLLWTYSFQFYILTSY